MDDEIQQVTSCLSSDLRVDSWYTEAIQDVFSPHDSVRLREDDADTTKT